MTRVFLALSFMLWPFAAFGQVLDQPPTIGGSALAIAAQTTPQRQVPPPPPPPDNERPRRRGSMVGYIQDAVVGSKVRIRFDAGFHNDAPDRAEFFYAKCGCYRDLPTSDGAYDPDAPGPRPGAVSTLDFQQPYLEGEYALNDAFSVFGNVPVRWLQPKEFIPDTGGSFPNHSGISDLRAGVKFAVVSDDTRVVTVQFQAFMPTGSAENGLGTDHWSFEPSFLYYQGINERIALESEVGVWLPSGGSAGVPTSTSDKFAGTVFFYGIGPSFAGYRSDSVRFAPVVELVGWHVLSGFATPTGDASGTNVVNLKIGARTTWDTRSSFYVGWGHALTTASWYDDIVRFEYRYAF
ncbi:MAG: transporter [Acidobacteriota bacterium]